MPWIAIKSKECPPSKPWAVVQKNNGKLVACHESKESAQEQIKALYAQESKK